MCWSSDMPLTLTLTHRPRLRLHQETPETREPWQVLHAEAGDLEGQLETLWLSAFLDFRSALDVSTLARAVLHGALPTEHALWSAWHGVTQDQTRLPLQSLLQASAGRIQEALTPGLQQLLEAPGLRFDVPTPDMTQFIERYVGQELVGVTETTRAQVRQIVRQAVASGRTHRQAATALREVVGLTPRQTDAVNALRQRLTDEGRPDAYITSQVELAADRGIRLRAQQIARTESMSVANAAQQQLNERAQDEGWLPADQKRAWLVTPDQRLCERCAPIPGMNPGGVALDEPFQTPEGPTMLPPLHPQCRCTITLVL